MKLRGSERSQGKTAALIPHNHDKVNFKGKLFSSQCIVIFGMTCAVLGIALCIVSVNIMNSKKNCDKSSQQEATQKDTQNRPNIIFLLLDDLGFNDVSWNNPTVKMPTMDNLARKGVILNKSYAHTVCSPSRAELMTGKYAHRLGIQHWVIEPVRTAGLDETQKILPESLQAAGYDTHIIGKWHLGACRKEFWPTNRGFDTFYGSPNGYIDQYTRCHSSRFKNERSSNTDSCWAIHSELAKPLYGDWKTKNTAFAWWDNDTLDNSAQGIHVTDLTKIRAKSIIERSQRSRPFFMYLPFFAPHVPIQSPSRYLKPYEHLNNTWRQEYLGMISHVDDAVGEIVQSLKDANQYDNTIIIMSSDNGGDPGPSSNYPLRGAKLSTYEGGQRVVSFISGAQLRKHGYVSNERFHSTDWYPTIMKLAGIHNFNSSDLDGMDQTDMLLKGGKSNRREIVYRIDTQKPATFGYATLSYDNYKLVLGSPGYSDGWEQDGTLGIITRGADGQQQIHRVERHLQWDERKSDRCPLARSLPYNFTLFHLSSLYGNTLVDNVSLFDLDADPEERNNLAELMPEKVSQLKARIKDHMRREVKIDAGPYYVRNTQVDNMWINGWCEMISPPQYTTHVEQ